ncbi:MAG: stage III sporulation protein AF [Pseudoflavonifractor sp.]
MIELMRSWLVGITAAALLVALAESLAPKGTVQKIGRLTGGLVLIITILQPLVRMSPQEFAGILTEYRVEASDYSILLETENAKLMKGIIEEETAAYILDKATALGITCQVAVTALPSGAAAYPIPAAVTVTGSLKPGEQKLLTEVIEADISIPADRQTYERGEAE